MEATSTENEQKVLRLIDYLTRLASLRTKTVRDLDGCKVLWVSDIPQERGCFTRAWGNDEEYDQDIWIEIQTTPEPALPRVPDICQDWVDQDSIRKTNDFPELLDEITRQMENPAFRNGTDHPRFISKIDQLLATMGGNIPTVDHSRFISKIDQLADHPNIKEAWEKYIEQKWMPWSEQHEKWTKIHQVYSILFTIHQEQLRLCEEYELVLGIGLLTWQTSSNQRVRRHLVVAKALLEFEARLGKFTIRPNPDGDNLCPELDMLDIEEQPVQAEETARESLKNAADDPWNKDCVEGVLKALVHSISPQGEYNERLERKKAEFTEKPLVEFAPALILRKRSVKGLTDILKSIKERIKNGGDIPPEFGDLAEITGKDSPDPSQEAFGQSSQIASEIYFPKPSNEEQRRIVEKIQRSTGVLVQGPPGTGKSHTIANLICHLLATGQRTLITAKTPRALQVLERLLPEELRPLCINLLGSGLEEKRSMEASVNAVLRKNEEWNEINAQIQIKENEQRLCQLKEEKAKIDRRLRAIREAETHSNTVANGTYSGTAAQIAQAIEKNRKKYDWFADIVPFETIYPFTDTNLIQFLEKLRWFTPLKKQEIASSWPDSIFNRQQFEDLCNLEWEATQEETKTSAGIDENFLGRISKADEEKIHLIHNNFSSLFTDVHKLKSIPHTWVEDAIRDVSSGIDGAWQELHEVSNRIVSELAKLVQKADSTEISLPEGKDPKTVIEDAVKLEKHLKNGGKLGWGLFRPKAVKPMLYITRSVRINGQLCNSMEHMALLVDMLYVRIELKRGWVFWHGRTEEVAGPYSMQFRAFESLLNVLCDVLSLLDRINRCKKELYGFDNMPEPSWHDEHCLQKIVNTCSHAIAKTNKRKVEKEIRQLESPVAALAAKPNAHPVVKELVAAIRSRDIDTYSRLCETIEQLNQQKESASWVESIFERIKQVAPLLSEELGKDSFNPCWDERIYQLQDAWRWSQSRYWLQDYLQQEDASSLAERARQIEDEIGKIIAQIASLRAWSFCFSRMREEHRRHMEAWQQSMRRLGKGTGKHAPHHRREAQKHLNACREAVPAWVMPLHRLWDTVDPAPGMFDVIIVDEASQCGFESLPLFYLGGKILIVGDDKQISPDAVGVSRNSVQRLMEQYLYDFNFKSSFDVDTSLFDHGKLRYGTRRITLREHFRCMPEIIRFSNDLCYSDTPLIPLRQYPPDRLLPINRVLIQGGYREGTNNRVINRPEAQAIVDKIEELCKDKKYSDKTMGVVVLQGEAQAGLIESQLFERIGAEEMERRRLICGNPYSFQGDERDIIFLSMVAAPNERIGPLTMSADERRFNVAASRARDQMWLFHSAGCNDLSVSCLRRRILEFFEGTKIQKIAGFDYSELWQHANKVNRSIVSPLYPFDSWFEVDVAIEIMRKGYQVIPQFEVAGRHIDLVVEGGCARLAVECDGDKFHGIEQYEQDMQRQRMLERCGWVFYRIRASGFYADRERGLTGLWRMLEERGIMPQRGESLYSEEQVSSCNEWESKRKPLYLNEECEPEHETTTNNDKIEIGDTVIYVDIKTPNNEKQALITRDRSNPEWGTINVRTPIAQALLGAKLSDVVEAKLPIGTLHLLIKQIKKVTA